MTDAEQFTLWGEPPIEAPRVVPVRPYSRALPGHRGAAEAATAAAMAVDEAPDEWKVIALAAVGWCAKHMASFTAAEVWRQLADYPDVGTHEPAALGPVLLRAERAGWINNSGERSDDMAVWSSRLYAGGT